MRQQLQQAQKQLTIFRNWPRTNRANPIAQDLRKPSVAHLQREQFLADQSKPKPKSRNCWPPRQPWSRRSPP